MRVITRWPALIPAIIRAGHEPVLAEHDPSDSAARSVASAERRGDPAVVHHQGADAAGFREADLPSPPVTAQPRGAQRYPR